MSLLSKKSRKQITRRQIPLRHKLPNKRSLNKKQLHRKPFCPSPSKRPISSTDGSAESLRRCRCSLTPSRSSRGGQQEPTDRSGCGHEKPVSRGGSLSVVRSGGATSSTPRMRWSGVEPMICRGQTAEEQRVDVLDVGEDARN